MKQSLLSAFLVAVVTCGVAWILSCGKEPTAPNRETPVIGGIPDTVDLGDTGTVVRISVQSDPPRSLTWNAYPSEQFLAVSPSQGSDGQVLTVTIDRASSSISAGVNYSHLSISTYDPNSGTFVASYKVCIVFTKLGSGAPDLGVAIFRDFDYGCSDTTECFTIKNVGGGRIDWTVEHTSSWLTVDADSGSLQQIVCARVNRSGLAPGTYRDTITVASNGGDTSWVASMIVPRDTLSRDLRDYWPLVKGNSWVWLSPEKNYWWAFSVGDSVVINGYTAWNVRADDSKGSTGDYWFTYVNDKLTVLSDSSALVNLPNIAYADCATLDCWSGYTFGFLPEHPQAGSTTDPFWNQPAEVMIGPLNEMLRNYPVWTNGMLSTSDFPFGSGDSCVGLRESGATDSLYTILSKGVGPILWDGYILIQSKINGVTTGSVPSQLQSLHFAVNTDPTSALLYWFRDDNGGYIRYQGDRDSGMPAPTHLIYNDSTGASTVMVMFRPDFIPVQWTLRGITISLDNMIPHAGGGAGTTLDPSRANHTILTATGQVDTVLDILPRDPYAVLDSLESSLDVWFTGVRDMFEAVGIQAWSDVVACAWIPGEQQPRWQAAAMLIGMGAALSVYDDSLDPGLGKSLRSAKAAGPGGIFIPSDVRDMAKKIGDYFKDEAACKYCPAPGVPTVSMLHCMGLKGVVASGQICHDSYIMYDGTNVGNCLIQCVTSTKCFTDICMPRQVATSDVDRVLFENNLAITPAEVRSLVKQNIDAFKGAF